ncbi:MULTISPECIES: hypothetical protein [Anaeromyxobacter]|uniref:hypothetical protein n=1 Tax=Anaeromyxobacter TaxID=161492 RepID=UPI001F57E5F5|nr:MULTISPECIES: hypothetical protein [unclassified Anaeromyxobacter]
MRANVLLAVVVLSACGNPGAKDGVGTGSSRLSDADVTRLTCVRAPELPAPAPTGGSCAGITVPALPPAITASLPAFGAGAVCTAATTDGTGAVAAGLLYGPTYATGAFAVWRADGAQAWYAADPAKLFGGAEVFGGPSGFLAYRHASGAATFTADGRTTPVSADPWPSGFTLLQQRAGYSGPYAVAPDGAGGALVVSAGPGDAEGENGIYAARFDAPGALRAFFTVEVSRREADAPVLRSSAALAVGADPAGHILVLWSGVTPCAPGAVAARWFDADGAPLGPPFDAGVAAPGTLVALLDGSLALQDGAGAFVRRFEAGKLAGGPVPAWLAAAGGAALHRVLGGRAYALARSAPDGSGACAQTLEIVAPDGEVCGTLALPGAAACERFPWRAPPAPWIGPDGTLVQEVAGTLESEAACTWRFWPAALR